MLTAAAVVTSAVVLAAPTKSGNRYPVQELSAEHRAYLDQVWTAMEASDLDALETLAKEDTLREIVVDVVAPYAHRLEEEYGFHGAVNKGTFGFNDPSDRHEGGSYNVCYNGEVLTAGEDDGVYLDFSYEGEVGSDHQNSYVHFNLFDYSQQNGAGIYYEKLLSFGKNDSQSADQSTSSQSLTLWDMAFQGDTKTRHHEPVGEWDMVERNSFWWTDRKEAHGNQGLEVSLHGTFQNELIYRGDNRLLSPCLHNGQVTISSFDSNGKSIEGTIDVVEGYTTRWDDTLTMERADTEYFYRVALKHEKWTEPLTLRIYAWDIWDEVTDVDPMYHQFRANILYHS